MSKTLAEMFKKAKSIELDRERKLILSNYAWMFLEEQYGSIAGALRGYAEMASGYRVLTHVVNWLYALVQEEIREQNLKRKTKEQETVDKRDIESMVELDRLNEYKDRVIETILAYYPVPDPLNPALGVNADHGTGSGQESSSPMSTAGTTTAS